jgi:hypothetical protein
LVDRGHSVYLLSVKSVSRVLRRRAATRASKTKTRHFNGVLSF